jgi:hypothetical protein
MDRDKEAASFEKWWRHNLRSCFRLCSGERRYNGIVLVLSRLVSDADAGGATRHRSKHLQMALLVRPSSFYSDGILRGGRTRVTEQTHTQNAADT